MQNAVSASHQSHHYSTRPSETLQNLKIPPIFLVFCFSPGHFCQNLWSFFKLLGKWSKFLWRKRGYCCVLSDFLILYNSCHIISVCVFSSSPESIILSLPSCCQPFHLCHTHSDIPICFHCFSFMCEPPTDQWVIGLSCCPLRSSKHLHLSSNPYLLAAITLSVTLHSLPSRSVRWD